ncbi:hypothetical protein ACQPZF_27440 [Actinosynnema sp. CS-041913]|uniref:hypothetical protein n=1 Tax=Actinosynnema sp. CS-041913 TaxID=3239917 RepID=UPI003D94F71F
MTGLPAAVQRLVGRASAGRLRAGLTWLVVRNRVAANLSAPEVWLWVETSGLRGLRTKVADAARLLGISSRQAHRRIKAVDVIVAGLLDTLAVDGLAGPPPPELSNDELLLTAQGDSFTMPEPARALDALTSYARNRQPSLRKSGLYLDRHKDRRYRDASRVGGWLATLLHHPPLSTGIPRPLTDCAGIELADDPQVALQQLRQVIIAKQRDVLPVLLAHTARLIPDVAAAGVDAWLSYLHLSYHAAMEVEHVSALRFAQALQNDAERFAGVGDPRVRRGLQGRGHILQMFGHYEAALSCFMRAVRHALHFPPSTDSEDELTTTHGALAQIVVTLAMSGRAGHADGPARRMLAEADRLSDVSEIRFTTARRMFELDLVKSTRPDVLELSVTSGGRHSRLEAQLDRFLELAHHTGKPNRILAAHDITLLYATVTRDRGLATSARTDFAHTTETDGYANLSDRFNRRLRTAAALSGAFADIAPVPTPTDPLRDPLATPAGTGLLLPLAIPMARTHKSQTTSLP